MIEQAEVCFNPMSMPSNILQIFLQTFCKMSSNILQIYCKYSADYGSVPQSNVNAPKPAFKLPRQLNTPLPDIEQNKTSTLNNSC